MKVLPNLMRKFLAIFFQLLYHQFAWLYDFVAWTVSIGQWKIWVQTPLPYLKKGKILELGFGPGHLQRAARSQNDDIYGLDLSKQMARIAQRRLNRMSMHPNLAVGDARTLPFADQSFDQIVATFPTEYFLDQRTLQEVYRSLATDGEMILVPMAWIQGKNPIHRFLAWVFKITGQSIDKKNLQLFAGERIFEKTGFEPAIQTIQYRYSEVLIIIAKKKNPD